MRFALLLLLLFPPCARAQSPPATAAAANWTPARYRLELKRKPAWSEGWFRLGVLLYEQEKGAECAEVFDKFIALQPKISAGHALRGLCLYQAKAFAPALAELVTARRIGLPQGEQLSDVASYHAALLFTKEENFERALQILQTFASRKEIDPRLIEAAGIAALRRPIFPAELPLDDRELVYRVGRAVMVAGDRRAAEAAELFRDLVRDFPAVPNLHYAYGTLLLGGTPDEALAMFEAELAVQPDHVPSLVLLAMENVTRGDFVAGRKWAERAVKVAPKHFTAHVALGRALVGLDDVPGGTRELELAAQLEPTSPQVRIALASAYQKAGNTKQAAIQRAEFQRLKKELEEQR